MFAVNVLGSGFAASQTLELGARVVVEPVADAARGLLDMPRRAELRQKCARAGLLDALAGRAPHGGVGGDDEDLLTVTVLGGEAFEHVVRMRGVPDGELSDRPFCSDAVEHPHPPR